ncbi:hypothetical protein [Pseudomonas syringae]|uniref:hypothetical protein n=1 Tax=Pseudomonas syringae TaxID=317 RepID=UPI0003826E8C|nr:hypothetical protein [Pseudomonas syringae]
MRSSKIVTISGVVLCGLWAIGASIAQAQASELVVNSNATDVSAADLRDVISAHLPTQIATLGQNYQVLAVVETSEYKPGERLYYYSVMLHRQITDVSSNKPYWVATGGVRSHGVIERPEQLLKNLEADLVAGASSFNLDQ